MYLAKNETRPLHIKRFSSFHLITLIIFVIIPIMLQELMQGYLVNDYAVTGFFYLL